MVKVRITQEYDPENMDNIIEHWKEELKQADEVQAEEDGGWITFEFDLPSGIAQRMKTMMRIFFGLDHYQMSMLNFVIEEESL